MEQDKSYLARNILLEVIPNENDFIHRPYVTEPENALRLAYQQDNHTFEGHTSHIYSVAFSPDGKYIEVYSSGNKRPYNRIKKMVFVTRAH